MNNIQIKRGNGEPPQLLEGELGYSLDTEKLYIGKSNQSGNTVFESSQSIDNQFSEINEKINSIENLIKIQNSSSGWFNIPTFMYDNSKFNPSSSTDFSLTDGPFQLCFFGDNHLRTRGAFRNKVAISNISANYLPIYNVPENWLDDGYGVYVRGGTGSRILKFIKSGDKNSDGTIRQNYLYQYINNGTSQTNLNSGSWIPLGNIDYYLTDNPSNRIIFDADYVVGCDVTVSDSSSTGFLYTTRDLYQGTYYIARLDTPPLYWNNKNISNLATPGATASLRVDSETGIVKLDIPSTVPKGQVYNLYLGGTWDGFGIQNSGGTGGDTP